MFLNFYLNWRKLEIELIYQRSTRGLWRGIEGQAFQQDHVELFKRVNIQLLKKLKSTMSKETRNLNFNSTIC